MQELLGYYTIAQTSYIMFVTVLICMALCLAWRVAEEELGERQAAEDWLKREDPAAFHIRCESATSRLLQRLLLLLLLLSISFSVY